MYMRRTAGVGDGFDRLESVPAERVRQRCPETLKTRIERRRALFSRMVVSPECVALPYFDPGALNGGTGGVENPPGQIRALPLCDRAVPVHPREVVVMI